MDKAYRGYLIRSNPFIDGCYWIEKDGRQICGAKNQEDAKRLINDLLSDECPQCGALIDIEELHDCDE